MAKKKRADKSRKGRDSWFSNLRDETLHGVIAVLSFLIVIISLLSVFNKAGIAGHYIYNWMSTLLGIGYYLIPVVFFVMGILFIKNIHREFDSPKLIGFAIFIISSLGIIDIVASKGGVLGHWVTWPFVKFFDSSASLVIFSALAVISILIAFNTELDAERLLFWKNKDEDEEDEKFKEVKESQLKIPTVPDEPEKKPEPKKEEPKKQEEEEDESAFIGKNKIRSSSKYVPPPLSLLEEDSGKPGVGDIKANANIIKRTLANFGIDVEMDEVSIGPSVTRYALKPAEGVKLARIVGLQNDLSLALAAHPIRIEAPIPGKSLVGVEIPNSIKTTVGLGTLLSSDEYQRSEKPLMISLGKGVSGKSYFGNLAKAPHLLIAGATGSGKSVTIHAIINSLLFRNSPENLRFIMIDPKRVELTLYNKIPHLLTPVITDAKKAILSLRWAAKEMDRRYDILQESGVRDIQSYHEYLKTAKKPAEGEEELPQMPYIVIVVDELADIMSAYPRELEAAIVRLAQMSRAVGIHLMLSTQRPSVNVITGLIKANVPSRIALQVASQIDSRTILDMIGAEKLLGAGDMLYMSGEMSKPERVQSAFISEKEVKKVVKHLIDHSKDDLPDEITLTEGSTVDRNTMLSVSLDEEDTGEEDPMYEQAKAAVIEAGKGSTSYIQRKLRVGYSRAARLLDDLERKGIVGPADGSKARPLLIGGAEVSATDKEEANETEL